MKLPSLSKILDSARDTLQRFPIVLISSALGSVLMIWILGMEKYGSEIPHELYNGVMTASLGIPLLLSIALISESHLKSKMSSVAAQAAGAVLLIIYFFSLEPEEYLYDLGRYFLFSVSFHLLVSFSPFIKKNNSDDLISFWDYNQRLFLRFLMSAFYSGVLFAGLSIAILSMDKLFNMDIKGERYGQLFFFIAGFFNTWFFLTGVPKKDELPKTKENFLYPKGLKIFTQYVLLPIVIIYLSILYVYLGKIIIEWQLPVGWVSYLVIGFSTAGIFSLLLIFPIKDVPENRWIRILSRTFFFAIIPLIILLFLAISARTGEYGITERRYYVFILALWLSATALYFLFTKFRYIKIIPVSLCLIAFITSFGPWGAFSLSLNSQHSRLEEILTANKIFSGGKVVKASEKVGDEDLESIYSILEFLDDRKQLGEIQPWFDINLDSIPDDAIFPDVSISKKTNVYKNMPEKIMKLMGLEYKHYRMNYDTSRINYVTQWTNELEIKGYEYFYLVDKNFIDTAAKVFSAGDKEIRIYTNQESSSIIIQEGEENTVFDLKQIVNNIREQNPETVKMTLDKESSVSRFRIIVLSLYGDREENKINLSSVRSYILYGKKKFPEGKD